MNERIQELKSQCYYEVTLGTNAFNSHVVTRFDTDKFAELLIQECAGVCEWQYSHKHKDNTEGAFAAIACSDAILEHFGVEE